MTLHSIVRPLLPQDRREVLGDLHERGFRLTDIVNVVPRVWISSLVRTLAGPVPRLTTAGDAAIRDRTEQLARQGARFFCGVCVIIWTTYLPFRNGP